ncbi:MAG: glutaredoxin 3 [Kiritimatiellia bacterium]|jgi:glutaredoxin 3
MSVVIYTTKFCPYCVRAKYLLQDKKLSYKEITVDGDAQLRQEMTQKSGRHTVPQIWIKGQHIGGCDELFALQRSGQLDELLAS